MKEQEVSRCEFCGSRAVVDVEDDGVLFFRCSREDCVGNDMFHFRDEWNDLNAVLLAGRKRIEKLELNLVLEELRRICRSNEIKSRKFNLQLKELENSVNWNVRKNEELRKEIGRLTSVIDILKSDVETERKLRYDAEDELMTATVELEARRARDGENDNASLGTETRTVSSSERDDSQSHQDSEGQSETAIQC